MKKSYISRAFANGILFIASLLLIEGFLHVIVLYVPAAKQIFPVSPHIPDQKLGKKGNPRFPGHDEWGFRNPSIPGQLDIVAIGDSQTYGTSVEMEEAWPFVLGEVTGRNVYNMAFPGYGPLESRLTLDLALTRGPKVVIFGLYFGNDFWDSFSFARKKGLENFIPVEHARKIFSLEKQTPLKMVNLFSLGKVKKKSGWMSHFRIWFSKNSKVYGVLREFKNLLRPNTRPSPLLKKDFGYAVEALRPSQLEYCSPFEGKTWRTILTAPYRDQALKYKEVRIQAGAEISKSAIQEMHNILQAKNINFLVVLFPTKENTFWSRVKNPMPHKGLESLVTSENIFKKEFIDFFNKENIQYLDLLPSLRALEVQPYFENLDGHPNPIGHKKIAEQIALSLSS